MIPKKADEYYYFAVWGHPVGKERARTTRKSRRPYTPDKTRNYEKYIKNVFLSVYSKCDNPAGKWELWVDMFHRGVHADGDNVLKIVADALSGMLWVKDRSIRDWRITLHPISKDKKEHITIKAWKYNKKEK